MAQSVDPEVRRFEEHYDQLGIIGLGGTGRVHKCISIKDKKQYAVKVCSAYDSYSIESLKTEIEFCKMLDHENIVKFIESFEQTEIFHLVFEMMTGGDILDDITKVHNYTEHEASRCIEQVFHGVAYLHSKHIIHRDLKPENILLQRNDDGVLIKIIDFGSAIQSDDKVDKFRIRLTVGYAAPEFFRVEPYWLPVDMWSCGAILYVTLFGQYAFFGLNQDDEIDKTIQGDYTFPGDEDSDPVCKEAKDLICHLFILDQYARYTVQDALNHPFIKLRDTIASYDYRPKTVANLKSVNEEKQKCQSEVLPQRY